MHFLTMAKQFRIILSKIFLTWPFKEKKIGGFFSVLKGHFPMDIKKRKCIN
jgi:hypothetical protein